MMSLITIGTVQAIEYFVAGFSFGLGFINIRNPNKQPRKNDQEKT